MAKKHSFTVFFEPNELKGYTVTVPALPGLMTGGRILEEAKGTFRSLFQLY